MHKHNSNYSGQAIFKNVAMIYKGERIAHLLVILFWILRIPIIDLRSNDDAVKNYSWYQKNCQQDN